jgi:hypothetical protein
MEMESKNANHIPQTGLQHPWLSSFAVLSSIQLPAGSLFLCLWVSKLALVLFNKC